MRFQKALLLALRLMSGVLLLLILAAPVGLSYAQAYSFQVTQETVHVFWNEDGTSSLDYVMTFNNDPSGHVIDFVDLSLPNPAFDENSVSADIDGVSLTDISRSGYQGDDENGVAIGLGSKTIPAGGTGTVHMFVGRVENVLDWDPADDDYVSAVFAPAWFSTAHGSTDLTVVFHLPPGVQPDEPRWHESPSGGWPEQPELALDENGRVTYTWRNPNATANSLYRFGASFPSHYVPESAVGKAVDPFAGVGSIFNDLCNSECLVPILCIGFFVVMWGVGALSNRNRKMKYLPPKISIEGHGIKRGLTAVEAAVLMEQPLDKVLTMIMFAVIKKNAARVVRKDPLEIEVVEPVPEDLRSYETEFLAAFKEADKANRAKSLSGMMVNLVKSVSQKMKGFSRRESVDYYKSIMEKAWQQVEAAGTPDVKMQKYDEVMEWTMLDKNYDGRTRDVFRTGPVFMPMWWGRYDPAYSGRAPSSLGKTGSSTPSSQPSGGGVSMPTLPGAEFAGGIVGGVQTFAQQTVGDISNFTSRVTNATNPAPKSTSRSSSGGSRGGGGGGCACACACAGCACACAGGGR